MSITIREISGKTELKRFATFPTECLYKNHPYYVPSLVSDIVGTFSPEENPAFDFCEATCFMAFRDGKPVGRIAGIINHQLNKRTGRKEARFGFVDFIDDKDVSSELFNAVENWARNKGMTSMHGPLGFTDMDPEGLLIEGYNELGTSVTIYSHPYYRNHIEDLGYTKENDWVEFKIYVPDCIPEKHQRITEIVRKKYNLQVVKYTNANKLINDYGQKIFQLINEAYDKLFGYSPLTQRQIDYYIKMYIPLVPLECIPLIVNETGELVGVGIAFPSLAKALQKSRGKLFPFGFIHLLKALKGKNDVVELLLVAVRPDYQSKGVNALLFSDLIPIFQKNGYVYAESNPEMEENNKVQSQWQYFERVQHKRRRAYCKDL